MNDWATLFLAVTAAGIGLMALIQIGVLIYGARLVRRVDRLASRLEREIDPLLGKVKEVDGEVARAAKLGAAQVERADLLMTRLIRRVEEVIGVAQRLIVEPVR